MPSLWKTLNPYQRNGVSWMTKREADPKAPGGFLCDEMGLGKTIQIIATIVANPVDRTLVIGPKSIVTQWKSEIKKFAPDLTVSIYDGTNANECADAKVTIAPYSMVINRRGLDYIHPTTGKRVIPTTKLHMFAWDRIVLDEGHEVRNAKSKTHISIRQFKSTIRWVVSGTPVFNSIKDFIALACFVLDTDNKLVIQQQYQTIRKKLILRRTMEDVQLALPPCSVVNEEIEMSPAEWNLYSTTYEECRQAIMHVMKTSTNRGMHSNCMLVSLLRCRQIMSHPQIYFDSIGDGTTWNQPLCTKHAKLLKYLQSHRDENSLVFSHFTDEMNILAKVLDIAGIKYVRIDGSFSQDKRVANIQTFNKSEGGMVFLIQIKAGGQGLNLQNATRVYIMSPWWNAAVELQAIGRSHRTGQDKPVHVRRLLYKGEDKVPSVEQCIMNLQSEKSKTCADVLNDPRLECQLPKIKGGGIQIPELRQIFSV